MSFCWHRHLTDECRTYPTIEKQKEVIRGSCYRCLRPGHRSRDCPDDKLCIHCGKWNAHHCSLCPEKFSTDKQEQKGEENPKKEVTASATEEQPETNKADSLLASEEKILIQTAKTTVKNATKDVSAEVRMFLDCASQRTYISQQLVDKLQLEPYKTEKLSVNTFGSGRAKIITIPIAKLQVMLKNGSFSIILANVVPQITGSVQRQTLMSKNWKITRELSLLIPYHEKTKLPVSTY